MSRSLPLVVSSLFLLAGCGGTPATVDSGSPDLGGTDGGATDTGVADASHTDAGPDPCGGVCAADQMCCVLGVLPRCMSGITTCPMPDVTVDHATAMQDLMVYWRYFAPSSCEEMEMCIGGSGWRRLLGFSTLTPNIGDADVVIGAPNTTDPHFMYSTCHMHYHFVGYADYSLLSGTTVAAAGHKQAFCLEDFQSFSPGPGVPTSAVYDCGNQGISRGWGDNYYNGLPCQWIDVTDVTPGDYTLHIAVNQPRPDGTHPIIESDYTNDFTDVPVTIMADPTTVDPTVSCGTAMDAPAERDCGWDVGPTLNCNPGDTVDVGCGRSCGGGTCGGDPVMRICPDATPCGNRTSLALGDDECGAPCPKTEFICPPSGTYTVLVGSYYPGNSYTCVPRAYREVLPDGGVLTDAGAAMDAGTSVDAGTSG